MSKSKKSKSNHVEYKFAVDDTNPSIKYTILDSDTFLAICKSKGCPKATLEETIDICVKSGYMFHFIKFGFIAFMNEILDADDFHTRQITDQSPFVFGIAKMEDTNTSGKSKIIGRSYVVFDSKTQAQNFDVIRNMFINGEFDNDIGMYARNAN